VAKRSSSGKGTARSKRLPKKGWSGHMAMGCPCPTSLSPGHRPGPGCLAITTSRVASTQRDTATRCGLQMSHFAYSNSTEGRCPWITGEFIVDSSQQAYPPALGTCSGLYMTLNIYINIQNKSQNLSHNLQNI